ncbi:membrane protein insertion efficiency factor YidD [Patescibacteria group bacterium]|nr:membrane protein insertion efficiency factor YidD [Patescibacteria group bacterium]MBU1931877.1 membrane protein insertion efficiency factor YidD [Patescibacteria group bacterium]
MKKIPLQLIRFYQRIGWFHKSIFQRLGLSDRACCFTPTCSQYSYEAINKYGIIKGTYLSLKRILRCHPWSKGGYDPI